MKVGMDPSHEVSQTLDPFPSHPNFVYSPMYDTKWPNQKHFQMRWNFVCIYLIILPKEQYKGPLGFF